MKNKVFNSNLVVWIWFALVATLAFNSCVAKAETAVHLGGWSEHLVTDEDYNSSHDAVLLEHDSWMLGRFNNSYGRESYTLAYGWHKQWGDFRGSFYAGAIKGYRSCFGDDGDSGRVCPMVYPVVSYTKFRVQPSVGLLGEALVFSVRIRLH